MLGGGSCRGQRVPAYLAMLTPENDIVSLNREGELVPTRVAVSMTLKSLPHTHIRNSLPEGTDSVIAELVQGGAEGNE